MRSATILVVEDNPITRKLVRVALHSDGYTVLEAPDGAAAVALLETHSPDLILQDLLLPDIAGLDLVRRLRAMPAGAAVPILAISGFLPEMEQVRSLQAGFTDYLFKPVEPSHLLRTVQAYLRPGRIVAGKPGQGRQVLIADDDPLQLKLLKVQLEQVGFQVTTAADGAEALARVQSGPPDAIVSDVLMPHLDGFRLCLAVRRDPRLAGVPVLLTSAVYTEEADQQLAQTVGARAFVLRSPDHRELIEALLSCFDGAAPPLPEPSPELPIEDYTHRIIRQLEHQVTLSGQMTRRLALLEVELGILARIVETLKNTPVLEQVLQELLYRCLDAAGISRGATYLLEPDGQFSLRARLGYSASSDGPLADFFGHSSLLHEVLQQGEPIELSSTKGGADRIGDLLARAGSRSMLLTPLILGEERLGVLQMATDSRQLGQDWLSFAKAVASQVVQAIELARTLAQLRASEQRYRELVEGLDAIIWEADARTGHYTFISQRSEKILGYPPGDWLADPNFREKLIHPDDRERALAFWRTVLAGGRDQVLEYRVVADDGRVVWLHDTIRAIRDPAGNARQLRGVIVDITARKRVEAHEADLRLAREVQSRLFPKGGSPLAGFDVAGVSHPAEAAGGDYFDYIPMPDGCLGIVIGDVSGHGLASALLMAETRACLRALAMTRTDVGEILALLNRTLCDDIPEDYFITLLFARIDPRTRSLVYSSAGHTTGYILAASGVVKAVLDSTALPLGIYPQADFPSSPPFALSPGDQILFLTDGIVEASAPDGTLFGTERPLRMVRLSAHESAHFMVENLYHAVRAFTRNAPQLDDITAVIVRVGPEAVESV